MCMATQQCGCGLKQGVQTAQNGKLVSQNKMDSKSTSLRMDFSVRGSADNETLLKAVANGAREEANLKSAHMCVYTTKLRAREIVYAFPIHRHLFNHSSPFPLAQNPTTFVLISALDA